MNSRRLIGLAYLAMAVLIIGPLWLSGYVLTLDMVFTPKLPWPQSLTQSTTVVNTLFHLANLVLPTQLIEKLMLVAIFAGAGIGMHRLVDSKNNLANYSAGILYAINPFTYGRLMAGQYLVLAGYALMPWFIGSLIRFVRSPTWATAIRVGGWTAAIGFVSIHYLGFAGLAGLVAVLAGWWQQKGQRARLVGWSMAIFAGLLIINSFWLMPLLFGGSGQASLISSFGERYFLTFHTVADPVFGQVLNTLFMYGFWGDAQGQYLLPKFAWWWVVGFVILALAGYGAWRNWRRNRFVTLLFIGVAGVGLVLGQGIMGSPVAELNYWLMNHVPIYRGYREPGKFLGLWVLGASYWFGLGVEGLFEWLGWGRERFDWVVTMGVVIPIIYTPTMLWGAANQLRAVDYPKDWYALNRQLDREHATGKVLFLPWHQYMDFGFAGRIIQNPASRFFDRPTIVGDDAEIGLIGYQSESSISTQIRTQILARDRTQVAMKLQTLGIEYVVLAKEADFKSYDWINDQPGLSLVSDSANLRVFRVVPGESKSS